MKQGIKISVMALIAMFAFSTAADAQFGALKKLAGKKNKKEVRDPREEAIKAKNAKWDELASKECNLDQMKFADWGKPIHKKYMVTNNSFWSTFQIGYRHTNICV